MAHPGNQIAIPNLCSPQVQTEYQLVSAVADPFSLAYKPLRRGGQVNVPIQVDFGLGGLGVIAKDFPPQDGTLGATPQFPALPNSAAFPQGTVVSPVPVGNINNGNPLLSIPPIRSIEWWHLTIWGQEIIRDRVENPQVTPQEIVRSAPQLTMLKAKITWVEFPSIAREIIVDIGTGIDIFIGPTNQVFAVEIMVPDVVSAPPVRPGAFTSSALPAPSTDPPRFIADTWVVASAWCVYGAVGRPTGRFTQSAFMGQTPIPITGQPFVDIPIPDNARRVQVFSTEENQNAPIVWGFENPVLPGTGTPVPFVTTALGSFSFVDGFTTRIVQVPQNAKFMRLRSENINNPRTMTAVFEDQQ